MAARGANLEPAVLRLGVMRRLWLSLMLLLLGCQPYLDHEPNRSEPASGAWSSGPKRPLELVELRGDQTSLQMVFNQPLRLSGAEEAPAFFEPALHPTAPIAQVAFEGMAGVRVTFAEPLAMSTVYRVEIPTGWRTETGLSLLQPIRRNWQTPRPELLSVTRQGEPAPSGEEVLRLGEGDALELTFNQPINLGSLQSVLRLTAAESGVVVPVTLQRAVPSERGRTARFTLRPESGVVPGRYHLELAAGLRGWQGPLRGEPSRRFPVDLGTARLLYDGELTVAAARRLPLKFSAPVAPEELLRCLVLLPDTAAPKIAVDGDEPSRVWLEFSGVVPQRLVLLAGLEGEASRLPADLVIALQSAEREPREQRPRYSTGPEEPAAGFLASERPFYAPGQPVLLAGATWDQPASGDQLAPVVELVDEAGEVIDSRPLLPSGNGFFHAQLVAPTGTGRYRLRAAAAGRAWRGGEFRVCPVASDGESYRLDFTEREAGLVVRLQRQGPRQRPVGLRARLFPSAPEPPHPTAQTESPAADQGVPSDLSPAWFALGQSRTSELEFLVDASLGAGIVVMEAFDLNEPELVVARLERLVPGPGEAAAQQAPAPALLVERQDKLVSAPLAGTGLRLVLSDPGSSVAGGAVALGGRALSGWSEADRFTNVAPRSTRAAEIFSYPLLSVEQAASEATFYDELRLEPGWELALPATDSAGEHRWRLLARDKTGSLMETEARIEIGQASVWRPFTPWAVRPGDRFEAGAEFLSSAQEAAVLGLTGTALTTGEALAPVGYLSTAGVVKRGAIRRLSFQYELPEAAATPTRLAWEFGSGGTLQRLQVELFPLQTPVVVRGGGRKASLETTAVRRLVLSEALPWRLILHPPESQASSALLDVVGSHGSLGRVHLRSGTEPVVLQGGVSDTLELTHLHGAAVSYELSALEPDRGELPAWGGKLYLLRRLLDEIGRPSEAVALGALPKVELTLVVPVKLPPAELRLPLPGGVRPLQLTAAAPGSPELLWSVRPGEVTIPLPELSAGEYRWHLDIEPVAAGDYLWPTATVSGFGGEPLALSGSGRLTVKAN